MAGTGAEFSSLTWKRSSKCDTMGCVEVSLNDSEVFVRDSAQESGPVLRFSRAEWRAFIAGARAGEFDLD